MPQGMKIKSLTQIVRDDYVKQCKGVVPDAKNQDYQAYLRKVRRTIHKCFENIEIPSSYLTLDKKIYPQIRISETDEEFLLKLVKKKYTKAALGNLFKSDAEFRQNYVKLISNYVKLNCDDKVYDLVARKLEKGQDEDRIRIVKDEERLNLKKSCHQAINRYISDRNCLAMLTLTFEHDYIKASQPVDSENFWEKYIAAVLSE